MHRLNLVLTANPLEFAAIFGEVAGAAATQAGAGTTAMPPAGPAVVRVGTTRRQEPADTGESRSGGDGEQL